MLLQHLENLLPSLMIAGQRWQPYCCWLLGAAMPCWFSWKRNSSVPIKQSEVGQNKQIILTWWRTSVRAALQVKSQPGSLQKCSPWFQSFPSLYNIVPSEIISSGPLILLIFSYKPLCNEPLHEIAYQPWFSLCTHKTAQKMFYYAAICRVIFLTQKSSVTVCKYIWGSFPEGVYCIFLSGVYIPSTSWSIYFKRGCILNS